MIGGRNIIVFICTFVGINAVCEMISSTGTYRRGWAQPYPGAHLIPASRMQGGTAGENTSVKTTIYYKKKDSGIKYDFSY